ncbi:uncharacterized protein LOC110095591 isoform X3 [Dendrobium catenatum]|uniref:uncharacterized protein LOC110095591 isoform X3 n=1 Tax=Dendrobium catenatum TaxID=906689 RepID=UPI00109FE1CD|nr:uncharacterized protein LOC110095591 isoform X3 [Dendrobium catenatum]
MCHQPSSSSSSFVVLMSNKLLEMKPAPPSPRAAPVFLTDCLEELLRLTLSASLLEDSDVSLGFSRLYCDNLLRDDPFLSPSHISSTAVKGVPAYPLYKHLARALEGCISSGKFLRGLGSVKGLREDEFFMLKQREWDRLIMEKGAELVNMMESVEFELHVQEPFFSQLRVGMKTAEGRCATEDYNRISAGSFLLFNRSLLLQVQDVRYYRSFSEMLEVELANALPGIPTVEEGVQIYRKFYTEEKEKSNGVLAIHVLKPASQPYILLGNLLSGLGCEGVGSLLGMMHTAGTVLDALPPPRSYLLSSFMKLHRPNVEGSTLTDAARSLAKHVHRSSEEWWGSFRGGDSEKNRLASEIVNHLLNECCWMNVYDIQTHNRVFEIRIHEGYGARWSHDGSKFIGFLEPYTEEGHSKGWKH